MSDIRVGIVDDVQVYRRTLRSVLEKKPLVRIVGEAENGRTAIDLVDQQRPDVLVMDISMPEMDGMEATRAIASQHPQTKIVILTMLSCQEDFQTVMDSGACAMVSKECGLKEVYEAILKCNPDQSKH